MNKNRKLQNSAQTWHQARIELRPHWWEASNSHHCTIPATMAFLYSDCLYFLCRMIEANIHAALQPWLHCLCQNLPQPYPCGHSSGGKSCNVIFKVDTTNTNNIHLISGIVQSSTIQKGGKVLV